MSRVVVRYRPHPDHADENQRLVEAVFAELAEVRPDGLRYGTFRLEDGSFVHIADVETDDNPLLATTAFKAFQENLGERCQAGEPPNPQQATLVGHYRLLHED